MTRNELIDDVEMRIYGGNPSDDSIVRSQIGAVIDSVTQTVMANWIRKVNGNYIPASITSTYNVTIKKRDDGCGKDVFYAEMPKDSEGYTLPLLALQDDEGLVEVEIGTQRVIAAKSYPLLRNSQELKFGKKLLYTLWSGDEILLYNGVFIEGSQIKVWGVFIDTSPDSTKPYPIVGDVKADVLNTATEILIKQLQTPQDLVDDGI